MEIETRNSKTTNAALLRCSKFTTNLADTFCKDLVSQPQQHSSIWGSSLYQFILRIHVRKLLTWKPGRTLRWKQRALVPAGLNSLLTDAAAGCRRVHVYLRLGVHAPART